MKGTNLNEDNKSILDLVNYIDFKIVDLRKNKTLPKDVINSLSTLYNVSVGGWMSKHYLFNVEPDNIEEEKIKDKLLEIISTLNNL
jgi:hypothetical protein